MSLFSDSQPSTSGYSQSSTYSFEGFQGDDRQASPYAALRRVQEDTDNELEEVDLDMSETQSTLNGRENQKYGSCMKRREELLRNNRKYRMTVSKRLHEEDDSGFCVV
jgi:hypothetical protein